jgi:hypothetical protein
MVPAATVGTAGLAPGLTVTGWEATHGIAVTVGGGGGVGELPEQPCASAKARNRNSGERRRKRSVSAPPACRVGSVFSFVIAFSFSLSGA